MDDFYEMTINQLESLKVHVEDMRDERGDVWDKDSDALEFAIDVIRNLMDGYKLCKTGEALEVIAQLAWKNHIKYGADVIELNDVNNIINGTCKL